MYYISDMLKFGQFVKICFVLFQTTRMDGGNYPRPFCQEIGVNKFI